MYPLTFAEFMSVYEGEKADGWRDYVLYGGIPLVLTFTTTDQKGDFLKFLFEETYISDIIGRNHVRNKAAGHQSEIEGLVYDVVRRADSFGVEVPMYRKIAEALETRTA